MNPAPGTWVCRTAGSGWKNRQWFVTIIGMNVLNVSQPAPNAPLRRRLGKWGRRSAILVVLVVVGLWAAELYALGNHHTVIPGRVYRCAQPSARTLRDLVAGVHVRTVINLRGTSHGQPWYVTESQAAHDLNLSQEDITFSANRLPAPAELRRLIDIFDHTEYPVVIHCKAGSDRTGLASAMAMLLLTDATLEEALGQLGIRYGHFRFGRTAAMDRFFDLYQDWLGAQSATHTPQRFRDWALSVYTPGPAKSDLSWLDTPTKPVPTDQPFPARVKAVNRSQVAWEFRPGDYVALHLAYVLASEDRVGIYRGKAGLLRATVPPGGEIVFDVVVPPVPTPGRYVLTAELFDATGAGVPFRVNPFTQFGDEAIQTHVVVK